MKTRKGNILNMGRDNEPVPGCTVSESIYDDGRQAITLFSLAKGTNISAERYPHPTMYLTLRGLPTFFSPDEWRAEAGEGQAVVTDGSADFGVDAAGDAVYLEIGFNNNTTMNQAVKNREVFRLKELLPYQEGKIVNMDVATNERMKFVVMSFDAGCALREHSAPGDAMVFCLDGEAVIGYEGKEYTIREGEQFVFEKGGLHSVKAVTKFKMALLLTLD